LSPRISTTVTVMSLLMTIDSFFFLDSTNIAAYPSWRVPSPAVTDSHALSDGPIQGCEAKRAGEDPLPLQESGESRRWIHGTAAGSRHGPGRKRLININGNRPRLRRQAAQPTFAVVF
jgi:hypothetical protein